MRIINEKINYVVGDATHPLGEGNKVIFHIVNNCNGWGSGFVLAIDKRWSGPQRLYREAASQGQLLLGKIQTYCVIHDDACINNTYVTNMVAQRGYDYKSSKRLVDYDALTTCLKDLAKVCMILKITSVHGPRIGAGRGRGDWKIIEQIIMDTLVKEGLEVFIYDLPNSGNYKSR